MQRRSLLLVSVSLLAVGCGQAPSSGHPFAVTANEGGRSLSRITPNDGRTITLALPGAPHNVQALPDGTHVLVTGMAADHAHGAHHASGTLTLVDAADFRPQARVTIPLGGHLAHVVTDARGEIAYVTDAQSDCVDVVDLAAGRLLQRIPTGRYPHGLRLHETRLYVANLKGNSVSVIDLTARRPIAEVAVGTSPVQVAVTPDGGRVFVTLGGEDAVAEIDTASLRVLREIVVGDHPAQVLADPRGHFMYVANQGTAAVPGQTVSVIDVEAGRVAATITTGRQPHGLVASPDGRFLYVTHVQDDTVAEIDTATFSVTRTFPVGDAPNGIAFGMLRDAR